MTKGDISASTMLTPPEPMLVGLRAYTASEKLPQSWKCSEHAFRSILIGR